MFLMEVPRCRSVIDLEGKRASETMTKDEPEEGKRLFLQMKGSSSENHQSFMQMSPLDSSCRAPQPWTLGVYDVLNEKVGCGPHHHG